MIRKMISKANILTKNKMIFIQREISFTQRIDMKILLIAIKQF